MRLLILITAIATFSGPAFAYQALASDSSFMFEPYVGVAKSMSGDQSYVSYQIPTEKFDTSYTQGLLGLRLSYLMSGFSFGVDANYYPSQKIKSKQSSPGMFTFNSNPVVNEEPSVARTNIGVNVGYRSDFFVWLSYFPIAQFKVTSGTSSGAIVSGDKLKGSGFGAGLGYAFLDYMSVALEYRKFHYDDDGTQASTFAGGFKYNLNASEALLNFSFPFIF